MIGEGGIGVSLKVTGSLTYQSTNQSGFIPYQGDKKGVYHKRIR
jgi:hypothetical protein